MSPYSAGRTGLTYRGGGSDLVISSSVERRKIKAWRVTATAASAKARYYSPVLTRSGSDSVAAKPAA